MYDEEDDLNTIVFMNADTTRTKYYFGHPVKYVDENGVTKDISLKPFITYVEFEESFGGTLDE